MAESEDPAACVDRLAAALERIAQAVQRQPAPAAARDGEPDGDTRARSLEVAARLDALIAELRAVLGGRGGKPGPLR